MQGTEQSPAFEIEIPGATNLLHTVVPPIKVKLPIIIHTDAGIVGFAVAWRTLLSVVILFGSISLFTHSHIIQGLIALAILSLILLSTVEYLYDVTPDPVLVVDQFGLQDRRLGALIRWTDVLHAACKSSGPKSQFTYIELKLREPTSMKLPSFFRLALRAAWGRKGKDFLIFGIENLDLNKQIIRNTVFELVKRNGGSIGNEAV